MQNLPLPFMAVQEMFYLRKLWYYVLNIQDQQTILYFIHILRKLQTEGEWSKLIYPKTHKSVCSKHCGAPTRFQQLEWGPKSRPDYDQLLLALTMSGRFKTNHQFIKYSFMPCDRVVIRCCQKGNSEIRPYMYIRPTNTKRPLSMQSICCLSMSWLKFRMTTFWTLWNGGL